MPKRPDPSHHSRQLIHFLLVTIYIYTYLSSVQSLSRFRLFATPWIAAHQASLSIINSQSLLKLMPIESVMPSSHLILCRPLLLLPPIPPSNRVFSNESTLCMRWPKYWSFSFSISPSNEHHTYMYLKTSSLSWCNTFQQSTSKDWGRIPLLLTFKASCNLIPVYIWSVTWQPFSSRAGLL